MPILKKRNGEQGMGNGEWGTRNGKRGMGNKECEMRLTIYHKTLHSEQFEGAEFIDDNGFL